MRDERSWRLLLGCVAPAASSRGAGDAAQQSAGLREAPGMCPGSPMAAAGVWGDAHRDFFCRDSPCVADSPAEPRCGAGAALGPTRLGWWHTLFCDPTRGWESSSGERRAKPAALPLGPGSRLGAGVSS